MTLTERQYLERRNLAKLLEVLDSRAPTADSLIQAINGAIGWGCPDPTPHLREALRHYLSRAAS